MEGGPTKDRKGLYATEKDRKELSSTEKDIYVIPCYRKVYCIQKNMEYLFLNVIFEYIF